MLRALALSFALLACRENGAPEVHLALGPSSADDAILVPRASLAELIEISPTESALLLNLSSEERGCDGSMTASSRDVVSLSMRVSLPAGAKLEPGAYPVIGAGQSSDRPHAVGTAKIKGKRHELPAGGEIVLTNVELGPEGSLSGLLKLEFTGDAERPASRVSGRFVAHFCRINRLR